jgi:hypothetical protein
MAPLVPVFTQHMLTVGIAPACDCWRIDLTAIQNVWSALPEGGFGPRFNAPNFRFNLTISKFGSIGNR